MIPGEIFVHDKAIECNTGKRTITIIVENTGDRPIQIGSHFHFFEANKHLNFDRGKTFGMRLNIPSGTGIRFQSKEVKEVELVELSGSREVFGLNAVTNGKTTDSQLKANAIRRLKELNFKGV
ncbi:Urease subunit beta [Syntrophobotulus glycolicus DSM 8271]|uniref:Urease subunit beta n=1 Tax=Syntrophobotulus glycolicus (strain DSM 8271 / FlGlyR) TaxID=645991 RepID=F0STY8_SYNGF|nr:urease subunit beta [Syntrophobotulus glycolicus]ADY56511.1 Urease subunit beta [Syntrophobotulus glycolicus DSM 8271]